MQNFISSEMTCDSISTLVSNIFRLKPCLHYIFHQSYLWCTPVASAGPSFPDEGIVRCKMIMTLQVTSITTDMQKFWETVNAMKCEKTLESHNLFTVANNLSLDFLTYECSVMSKTSTKPCLVKQTQRSSK